MTDELATRMSGKLIKVNKAPEGVARVLDMEGWAQSIVNRKPYVEPDPEFLSRMLAWQTITAESAEEVFRSQGIKGLQEMIPDTPGAGTGPIEITDLYVASSDFETGNPCYVIITATDLELTEEWKGTTGATNVQATLLALLANGVWPIRCQIIRGEQKDRGGRYLLLVVKPD